MDRIAGPDFLPQAEAEVDLRRLAEEFGAQFLLRRASEWCGLGAAAPSAARLFMPKCPGHPHV